MRTLIREVFAPFYHNGKVNWPLVVLFILINLLVSANAILHDPYQGYDAGDHIHYIKTLADKRTIPTCADTAQCYIPPLPYMLPAIILATGRINLWQAAKLAQLVNILLSLGLTYYLLKICDLIDSDNLILKLSSLSMLGILPVYYKTYSLIRGEPYLGLLAVFIAYQVLSIFRGRDHNLANLVLLGLAVGLSILARQWGFLVLPAIFLAVTYAAFKDHSKFRLAISTMAVCLLTPILLAGWYYYIMYQRYGSLTAWDRPPSALSLNAFPLEFYFGTGSGALFTDPIRPNFPNQFPAIFYSDTWGDYSAYFLIFAKDTRTNTFINGKGLESIIRTGQPYPNWLETNRFTFNSYLGQVNLVSLLPSAILIAGLIFGFIHIISSIRNESIGNLDSGWILFTLIVMCSLTGYGWYLLRYQNHGQGGDLIKASHMLQVFPFLGLLAGGVLEKLWKWRSGIWITLMIALALIFLHNLPAMVTHYPLFP